MRFAQAADWLLLICGALSTAFAGAMPAIAMLVYMRVFQSTFMFYLFLCFRETANILVNAEQEYKSPIGLKAGAFYQTFMPLATRFLVVAAIFFALEYLGVRFLLQRQGQFARKHVFSLPVFSACALGSCIDTEKLSCAAFCAKKPLGMSVAAPAL